MHIQLGANEELVLRGIFEGVQALEFFPSKVARIVGGAEKMGIKIRWLDKVITTYALGGITSS